MRIVILSDIHGNTIAMDAVLQDCRRHGEPDAFWILGDLVATGPDPVGVCERIDDLPNVRCIRGNTDRYVATGDRPPPSIDDAANDPAKLPALVECAGTFAWTQGAITQAGRLEWLAQLPLAFEETLPDGTRLLCVHAAPGRDAGTGFSPSFTETQMEEALGENDPDLLLAGHCHRQLDTTIRQTRVVNVGSVSLTLSPPHDAGYALLETTTKGHRLELRSVPYDRDAVIAQVTAQRNPGSAYIIGHMRGERAETAGERPEVQRELT